MLELLGKLPQIIQHLWCQFTASVRSYVHLDDGIKQFVDLLQHFCAHIFVLFNFLVSVGQVQSTLMREIYLRSTQERPRSVHNGPQERGPQGL